MPVSRPTSLRAPLRAHRRVLVAVTPAADDHRHAFRVAAGLAVPGVVLLAAGRPDLILYAVFGAVTGMYGRGEPPRRREVHQAQAAAILVTGVGIGVFLAATAAPPWALVTASTLFAAAGSLVTDRLALRPGGPFFGLFALGAVATVPPGRVGPWAALSICAATAALCLAISVVDAARRGPRVAGAGPPRAQPSAAPVPGLRVHAARYAVAVALAGTAGLALGIEHANWVIAAAAVPLAAADAAGRVRRGIHRVVGTFAGLVVTAALLFPDPSGAVLAVCVIALLFPTELFMSRHYALAMGFFTPLIMVMVDLADPAEPATLIVARGIDTLLGVGIGVAVAVTVRDPHDRAALRLRRQRP